jgi:membrane-associated protein
VKIDWRIVGIAVLVLIVGAVALYAFKKVDLENLIETIGYPGLFIIIFAETGLLIGFFLPGDTLLITTGLLCQRGVFERWDINGVFLVIPLLIIAAILGDATGYQIGKRAGPRLYQRKDSRLFRRDHLEKATEFYQRHGGKTIILARFLAFIRTFAPTVAGAAGMPYEKFAFYNVVGGVTWVTSMTLIGYYVGKAVPNIDAIFLVLVVVMVALSVAPAAIGYLRTRRSAAKQQAS